MSESGRDASAVLEQAAGAIRVCTRCRLHEGRAHAVPGDGPSDADIVLIGEAPGREEDMSGRPFVGAAGKILDNALRTAKIPRGSVFVTNIVKCRPPSNRAPRADEIDICRPYLMSQIDAVHPKVIATLGSSALRGLLGSREKLRVARETYLSFGDVPVVASYHPAAVLYNRRLEATLRRDLRKVARIARSSRPTRTTDKVATRKTPGRGREAKRSRRRPA